MTHGDVYRQLWLFLMLDMNAKQSQDGVTPLHMACRYNSGDVTQYLLSRQADVNVTDTKGRTPLHYATRRGNDLVTKACYRLSSLCAFSVCLLLLAYSVVVVSQKSDKRLDIFMLFSRF